LELTGRGLLTGKCRGPKRAGINNLILTRNISNKKEYVNPSYIIRAKLTKIVIY
jgi:hypothetical protein